MTELNNKEYWVVIPFSSKSPAIRCLNDLNNNEGYEGFVVERNAGEYKAVENQRIREE